MELPIVTTHLKVVSKTIGEF